MTESPALQLTRRLVQTDTTPTGDVGVAAAFLTERLEEGGFRVQVHRYGDGQVNLVATHGDPELPGPCLTGHMDTVPVNRAEWSCDPWGAEIIDGHMFGRGVADMKAGVAAAVEAAITYAGAHPDRPLSLILTAEEEVGLLGAAALAAEHQLPAATCLVVAEPTDVRPRVGHRGALWLDVAAKGRSCHGSTPELGSNAILALVDDLKRLANHVRDDLEPDPHLGPATMNVGVIRGGLQRNIVPDHAVAEVDIRLAGRAAREHLLKVVQDGLPSGSGVEVRVDLTGVVTEPTHPLLAAAARIAGDDDLGAARFFTDASVLTPALGDVPTVIWGPGSPDQAHVVDERCPVEQIDRAVAQYLALLTAMGAGLE